MPLSRIKRREIRQASLLIAIIFLFVSLIFLNYVFFSTRAFIYEESIRKRQAPLPGRFLTHVMINNESYCNFNYGLPWKLNFTREDLKYPPQEGLNSSYRVLYNVVETSNEYTENLSNLTSALHVSVDFVMYIPEFVRKWGGRVSIAAFLPSQDADIFFEKFYHLCLCLPEMSKVAIHLVFPINYEPFSEINSTVQYKNCIVDKDKRTKVDRVKNNIVYPINVVRNVAREASNTFHVMVSDIELIPSEYLAENFMEFSNYYHRSSSSPTVFVIPIFEIDYNYKIPNNKEQLVELVDKGAAVYFHRFICPHCQKFPGIEHWLERKNVMRIMPFLSVKREFPYHRWEPIFIGTKQEPLYDESLSWEGKQDKMPQMLLMCLLDYKLVILDGAFLIHWPGIKKKQHNWKSVHIRKNGERYRKIIENISKLPNLKNHEKCKVQ